MLCNHPEKKTTKKKIKQFKEIIKKPQITTGEKNKKKPNNISHALIRNSELVIIN